MQRKSKSNYRVRKAKDNSTSVSDIEYHWKGAESRMEGVLTRGGDQECYESITLK